MEWHLAELKMLQALRAAWACPFLDKSLAFVTRLGDHGLAFILLALVLLCIPKTRKLGLGVGIALILDFLLVNLGLKPLAGRTRPYDLGVPLEILVRKPGDFSFPSGHVTAAAAGMTALYRAEGKKYLKPGIIWVLLMAVSRNYLMAHYPSDVLFAAIFGVASGFIAWEITKLIFRFLEEHDDNRLCALALDFDLPLPDIGLRLPLSGKGKKNAPDKDGDDAAPRRDRADTGTAGRSYDGESRRERPAAARKPSGRLEKLGIRRKKGRHEL